MTIASTITNAQRAMSTLSCKTCQGLTKEFEQPALRGRAKLGFVYVHMVSYAICA